MTSHRPHPMTGPWPYRRADTPASRASDRLVDRVPTDESIIYDDPDDALLFDGCERCDEHARNLVSLDPDKFAALWLRMLEVERDSPDYTAGYRTKAEATAGLALYRMALLVERHLPEVNPWVWPWQGRLTIEMDGMEVIL